MAELEALYRTGELGSLGYWQAIAGCSDWVVLGSLPITVATGFPLLIHDRTAEILSPDWFWKNQKRSIESMNFK